MMEVQMNDVELEEGEISDNDDNASDGQIYNPLPRPESVTASATVRPPSNAGQQRLSDDNDSPDISECSSADDSDDCQTTARQLGITKAERKQKMKRLRRTPKLLPPLDLQTRRATGFKRNNIWTHTMQEDALTENMSGIGVTESGRNDRNVENYDYMAAKRMQDGKAFKRRLSESSDDQSRNWSAKRMRPNDQLPAKQRLGPKSEKQGRRGKKISTDPLILPDIGDTTAREPDDIAKEIAKNLQEENVELIERVVEVLSTDIVLRVYKKTQEIEAKGGLLILDRSRRRLPGGVFLNLLKHEGYLNTEQRSLIFDRKQKSPKIEVTESDSSKQRERKVEELRERLNSSTTINEPPLMVVALKEHISESSSEQQTTSSLSNPPPSPAGLLEHSPDYKTLTMNDTDGEGMELAATPAATNSEISSQSTLLRYEDDCIDLNYGDMDFL